MSKPLVMGVVLAALVGAGRLQAETTRAVLEKAVRAYGGADKLARLQAVKARGKGAVVLGGASTKFTSETAWQEPDRLKLAFALEVPGKTRSVVQVYAGDQGWASADGKAGPLEGVKLDEMRAQAHVRRVLRLTPLLQDKGYRLSLLSDARVNGKPAAVVKVSAPGERDVTLSFDKGTGLLARVERQVFDEAVKREVPQEEVPGDFKELDGLPTAMKEVWLRDGKKVLEMTYSDVRYPARIEDSAFADPRPFTRTRDVIYGRKTGVALTMDVYAPKKGGNGAAVVVVMSGGWVSDHEGLNTMLRATFLDEALKRGYTAFTVFHGSQPRFAIPDAVADVNRAVRYIRSHARAYRIDPYRVGITGASAGGHLSLMQGTAGDLGDPKASDPVERTSSRVQAVACFFPPTDFLNYGGEGQYAFARDGVLAGFRTAFDIREFDSRTKRLERVSAEKARALARRMSPITHVSADDPPTLIIHGDADKLVPIQQARAIVARLKEAGVTAELDVKKGAAHSWPGLDKDAVKVFDWFDRHLRQK